jgi:hypothetical protein
VDKRSKSFEPARRAGSGLSTVDKETDMRWIRKAVVLGLAVLGAQRLYELLAPRATQFKERVTPRVNEAVGMAKDTASGITEDVKRTATGVQEQVADLAEQERKQAERIGAEVQSAATAGATRTGNGSPGTSPEPGAPVTGAGVQGGVQGGSAGG